MNTKTIGFVRENSPLEKIIRSKIFWILFVAITFSYPLVRSINRTLPPPLPVLYELPEYKLTNEFGKSFGSGDLKGRIYLANFAFTSCPTTCPALMEKLQKIQKRVRGLGTKVALVTYTVDPANDTPKVLYKHSRSLQANPRVWTFLTGEKSSLQKLLVDGFKVPLGDREKFEGAVDGEPVTMFDIAHTEKIVLVDNEGKIRGYYPSTKNGINKLMIDVGLLVNRVFFNRG